MQTMQVFGYSVLTRFIVL